MVVFTKSYRYHMPVFYTWSVESAESRLVFDSSWTRSVWMVPGTFSLED